MSTENHSDLRLGLTLGEWIARIKRVEIELANLKHLLYRGALLSALWLAAILSQLFSESTAGLIGTSLQALWNIL